jgi:transcriptional regulator with XRE-family HTH domain
LINLKYINADLSAHGYAQTGRFEFRPPASGEGLTQEEIEARSGFSQQYLSGLERGQRNPTVIMLYELAQALDVRSGERIILVPKQATPEEALAIIRQNVVQSLVRVGVTQFPAGLGTKDVADLKPDLVDARTCAWAHGCLPR